MERVVNQLILQNQNLLRRVSSLEFIVESYHEWKKDTEKFSKFIRDKVEKLDKNRADSNIPDKRQKEISR